MNKNFWKKLNKPILALAPMAGITDSAFRQICRKNGADVVYSEMASVSALYFKPRKTLELLKFKRNERPYVVQLFGKDPKSFAKATQIVTKRLQPHGIDINFGCPAKKVFGHGSGCALMPDTKLARDIIVAVCDNTDLPVSLKIRAGIKNISALDFIKNVKDLPFSAVMVHCRTYEQGFRGEPDYSIAQKIKKIIPEKVVLANGGITNAKIAFDILNKYPELDGLGIARGAQGRPWIFEEIKELFHGCQDFEQMPLREREFLKLKEIALAHSKLLFESKGERGMFEIRKHLAWYFKGLPGAAELRKKLVIAKSVGEIKKILDKGA